MSRSRSKPTTNTAEAPEAGVAVEQCLLVQEEIWRIVSDVAQTDSRLSLGQHAQKVAGAFPGAGLSPTSIADALVYAAVDFGVPIEVKSPALRPAAKVQGLFGLVGRKRKTRSGAGGRPTLAGIPLPATT
jgi:hypothetical protein